MNSQNVKSEDKENTLSERVSMLEKQIELILDRNKKVEAEKAWEISGARRLSIVVVTYVLMSLLLSVIGVTSPLVNAIIPTLGYFLSTLYLGIIKDLWVRKNK